jgi:Holliday junction resolvase-like predicted endonuclease
MSEYKTVKYVLEVMQSRGWSVVEQEWEGVPSFPQFGIGDLLMKRGDLIRAVECKWIDSSKSGRNVCTKRTQKRKKVKDQTLLYAAFAKLHFPTMDVKGVEFVGPENKVLCKTNSVTVLGARKHIHTFLRTKFRRGIPRKAHQILRELSNGEYTKYKL